MNIKPTRGPGRPPEIPDAVRANILIPRSQLELMLAAGNGNLSRGIRLAIEQYAASQEKQAA